MEISVKIVLLVIAAAAIVGLLIWQNRQLSIKKKQSTKKKVKSTKSKQPQPKKAQSRGQHGIIGMSTTVSPLKINPDSLKFKAVSRDYQSIDVTIMNLSVHRFMFCSMSTSCRENFLVRPDQGIIKENDEIIISITCLRKTLVTSLLDRISFDYVRVPKDLEDFSEKIWQKLKSDDNALWDRAALAVIYES